MRPPVRVITVASLGCLLAAVAGLQALQQRVPAPEVPGSASVEVPMVRSGAFVARAALAYDSLAADVYWLRVVQQFGRTKLSSDPDKRYDFLYPLLDITTSLDPRFEVAYRFGAVFLSEPYPGGAGRPDLALTLLEKGLAANPRRWEYAQDIGFVHYWYRRDYTQAAEWFTRAARIPLSPNWLAPMAAITLTEGGDRRSARRLWTQVFNNTDADWLMDQARFRLMQLDALDQIEALQALVARHRQRTGVQPRAWEELIRTGGLGGVPLDPRSVPYALDPFTGTVALSTESPLNPLPTAEVRP